MLYRYYLYFTIKLNNLNCWNVRLIYNDAHMIAWLVIVWRYIFILDACVMISNISKFTGHRSVKQSNVVSHWLGANVESALNHYHMALTFPEYQHNLSPQILKWKVFHFCIVVVWELVLQQISCVWVPPDWDIFHSCKKLLFIEQLLHSHIKELLPQHSCCYMYLTEMNIHIHPGHESHIAS